GAAGVDAGVDPRRGPVFSQRSMAIDAAIDGQGVALARTALCAWDLLAGRLVRPFRFRLPVPYAYWIVCPKANAQLPKIATFRDWLLAEAAEDERRLAKLCRRRSIERVRPVEITDVAQMRHQRAALPVVQRHGRRLQGEAEIDARAQIERRGMRGAGADRGQRAGPARLHRAMHMAAQHTLDLRVAPHDVRQPRGAADERNTVELDNAAGEGRV